VAREDAEPVPVEVAGAGFELQHAVDVVMQRLAPVMTQRVGVGALADRLEQRVEA
jgi:hypothetical protein